MTTDIKATLAQRGSRYGDWFEDSACADGLIQHLKDYGWKDVPPMQRHALRMILTKVSRIVNGDPTYADNWHDIAGYATLVEARLKPHVTTRPMRSDGKEWDDRPGAFNPGDL